jgi:hypothetical protein
MPKRRPHNQTHRSNRPRRDRPPPAAPSAADDATSDIASTRPDEGPISTRPLRPTQRGAGGTARFVRATPQSGLDLATEYAFVARDLRQIGALALVAFVVLGVLGVTIR